MIRPALVVAFALALATPAVAEPNCIASTGPRVHFSMGISVGGTYTQDEQAAFDRMHLRQAGIDADSVGRTRLGCLQVTRFENGRYVTEFYDPRTLELKPLNLDLNLR